MEFLNYHHLRYFWMIAREGSLRKAAEELCVSQSTISAQIQALEGVLGEKLFRRDRRQLALTETGQHVLSYAEEIFSLGQELLHTVKQRPTARPLRLQVGIVDSLPKRVSYQLIKPIFQLPHPVQAVCREGKMAGLLSQLAAYRLDIVLADEPAPSSLNIKAFNHRLGECGVVFCARPELAGALKRRFPQSLNETPALLPATTMALRRSLEQWFQAHHLRPRVIAEFEDAALMEAAALDGLGFMPVPRLAAKEIVTRHGFRLLGAAEDCRLHLYAVSAERKLTHPAVVAITEKAQSSLAG